MSEPISAHPLCWPPTIPRSVRREAGAFKTSLAGALKADYRSLAARIRKLRAENEKVRAALTAARAWIAEDLRSTVEVHTAADGTVDELGGNAIERMRALLAQIDAAQAKDVANG